MLFFFFFQAEDGIRDYKVTGVQTCALPIFPGWLDSWQVDLERGPLPRLAVHPDVAAALLHDAVHGREPEARALAEFLGGEERLEQTRPFPAVHTHTPVGHPQQHKNGRAHRPALP